MTRTQVSMYGLVGGYIWMPNAFCAKHFSVGEGDFRYHDNSRPTIRDMVLKVTNDGDFQSCSIVDATVEFKRINTLPNGEIITRRRLVDIRQFKSVNGCVFELESDDYWRGIDAVSED